MKILHCSDIHLGSTFNYLNGRAFERQNELMLTFEKIISLCKTENVELLLIAGDLFENTNPPKEIVERVKRLFESIPNIFVAISAGNHDCFSSDSPYATYTFSDNVHIFSAKWEYVNLPQHKARIWGHSFENSYMSNSGLENIKVPDDDFTNIMVLHGDIISSGQSSRYNPITIEQLTNTGMDYIALGHIHKRSKILKTGLKTYYSYSGCPEGRDFGETGEKGVYIGEVSKNKCVLDFYKTSNRMCLIANIDITGFKTEEEILKCILSTLQEKYGSDFSKHLYQINLTGNTDKIFDTNYILTSLKNKLYYIQLNNNLSINADINRLSAETTLKGCFVRKMLERICATDNQAEIEKLQKALYVGLEAFEGRVSIYED